jgi:hypothetical protein
MATSTRAKTRVYPAAMTRTFPDRVLAISEPAVTLVGCLFNALPVD